MNKGLEKLEVFDPLKFVECVSKLEANSSVSVTEIENTTFPMLELKKNKFDYLFSLPFSLYTCIDKGQLEDKLLIQLSKRKLDSLTVNFPPFTNLTLDSAKEIAKNNKYVLSVNTCHVVETDRSLDEIVSNFNSTRKKHIKRYQKAEMLSVFQTTDPFYFEEYYKLYLDSINRWGEESTGYSKELIASLHTVPGIRMWVAELEGKVVSAMICIYHEDHVFDWLAASIINEDIKKLYAPVAVQFEVIKNAVETGLKYVNMGASVNLAGVSDFKDSWGATEQETYTFNKQSTLFKVSKKIVTNLKKLRS